MLGLIIDGLQKKMLKMFYKGVQKTYWGIAQEKN